LQLRPTGWRAWWRPALQAQVREDLLDHRLLKDRRDDLQLAAAVRAVRHVDLESAASAKTDFCPSYVAAETRSSSLAQLNRTGRWCAQVASHSTGSAACAGGSLSWGTTCRTTSARSLALGATTPSFAQRGSAHFAQRSYADTKRIRCSLGLRTRAARRCMNSSGDNLAGRALAELGPFGWHKQSTGLSVPRLSTRWVVPSRQGVLSLSTTCPAALVCTRSFARAGRVM